METKIFTLDSLTRDGPQMKQIDNAGFVCIDGVYRVILGDVGIALVLGTVTRNGHFNWLGWLSFTAKTGGL